MTPEEEKLHTQTFEQWLADNPQLHAEIKAMKKSDLVRLHLYGAFQFLKLKSIHASTVKTALKSLGHESRARQEIEATLQQTEDVSLNITGGLDYGRKLGNAKKIKTAEDKADYLKEAVKGLLKTGEADGWSKKLIVNWLYKNGLNCGYTRSTMDSKISPIIAAAKSEIENNQASDSQKIGITSQ